MKRNKEDSPQNRSEGTDGEEFFFYGGKICDFAKKRLPVV